VGVVQAAPIRKPIMVASKKLTETTLVVSRMRDMGVNSFLEVNDQN
jgi:hypothetical protein